MSADSAFFVLLSQTIPALPENSPNNCPCSADSIFSDFAGRPWETGGKNRAVFQEPPLERPENPSRPCLHGREGRVLVTCIHNWEMPDWQGILLPIKAGFRRNPNGFQENRTKCDGKRPVKTAFIGCEPGSYSGPVSVSPKTARKAARSMVSCSRRYRAISSSFARWVCKISSQRP